MLHSVTRAINGYQELIKHRSHYTKLNAEYGSYPMIPQEAFERDNLHLHFNLHFKFMTKNWGFIPISAMTEPVFTSCPYQTDKCTLAEKARLFYCPQLSGQCHTVKSVQIDIPQRGDGQTEPRLGLAAVQSVEADETVLWMGRAWLARRVWKLLMYWMVIFAMVK